jgi:spore germination protein YaaH
VEIKNFKLVPEENGYSLFIYVEEPMVEFSNEFGYEYHQKKTTLRQDIREIVHQKFPNVKVNSVKIIMGTMLLGTIPFGQLETKAATINQTSSTIGTMPYVTYIVQSGDTLTKIAKANGISIDQITSLNKISGTIIYVGQPLNLPFVSHTVVSGDSLYSIAKKYSSTVDSIKVKNNLKSNIIFVGQKLLVPVNNTVSTETTTNPTPEQNPIPAPSPTPSPTTETKSTAFMEYKVVSGDSLYGIARSFNTTVTAIKRENNLTSDSIFVGQILKISTTTTPVIETAPTTVTPIQEPAPSPAPSPDPNPSPALETNPVLSSVDYVVISGDTLSRIANKYGTTVNEIKQKNNLTSDMIYVGQRLIIPVKQVVEKDLTPPAIPTVQYDAIIKGDNLTSFAFSGTTEANATIFISLKDGLNEAITKEIKADESGTYHTNIDFTSLKDGPISVSFIAMDPSGNKSIENTIQINKDTVGPKTIEFNALSTITKKNSGSYPISGVTEPNAKIELSIKDGNHIISQIIQADGNGNFSFLPDVLSFSDGNLTVTAVPQDQYGNIGKAFEATILKDTSIDPVANVEVENAGIVNKDNVKEYNVRGTSNEEGGIVKIEVSDGVNSVTEESLVLNSSFDKQINLSKLKDGNLTVKITQTDQSGNSSDQVTTNINKDTVVNDPIVFTSGVERTASGFFYKIKGQAEPNSTVELTVLEQTGTNEIKQSIKTDKDGRFELVLNISSIQRPFVTMNLTDTFGNKSSNSIVGITNYIVGSGDSLWTIANRFNTSIDSITTLNSLSTTVLNIGQELKLPVVAGIQSPAISEQEFFNMGYLYFGNSQTYIESVNQTANTINVVSPSYFDLNSDGSLKLTPQFDRQFIVSSQSSGIRVVPFLSNHWDRATGEKALQNREQLSTQIAETIRIYNLDGINVDIENVTDEYRDEYTDFVRLLREKIPQNKEVSVAVAANPNSYTQGWQGSYHYSDLAKYSDYLMIMAYDESYPGSAPGPVASIGFVEKSIQYALDQGVAKDQIVVGVGHYGRYWKEGSTYGGDGISNWQIEKAVNMYNGTVMFDEKTKSAKAVFTIKQGDPVMTVGGKNLTPGTYTVWFENADAIKAKIDLVHKYGVKGLGNWSIGQDNPKIWTDISTWLKDDAAPVSSQPSP